MEGHIFLTGGTGSLGKAILKRARDNNYSCRFTIYSRDEVKQSELRSEYPEHRFVLGDICDYEWLGIAMRNHDYVIHTAAYKQVPAAEVNVGMAIEVNVIGSRNVARAAINNGINRVIGISTDKACAPINTYGMTKALMEKAFQEADRLSHTAFALVRYGNVLGSRGSVVPLFQKQKAAGVLTLTDPNMTRFWLTLEDAVDLVEFGFKVRRGCILVPKASASSMIDLARAVAPECDIKTIGIRPGEKRHEQLVNFDEVSHTVEARDGFVIHPAYSDTKGDCVKTYHSIDAPMLSVCQLEKLVNGECIRAWNHNGHSS